MRAVRTAFGRTGSVRHIGLRLLLLAALSAFVAYQDPAASLHVHSHAGPHTHCCAACHSGQFMAVPAAEMVVPCDALSAWCTLDVAQPRPGNAAILASSSRAPPVTPSLQFV